MHISQNWDAEFWVVISKTVLSFLFFWMSFNSISKVHVAYCILEWIWALRITWRTRLFKIQPYKERQENTFQHLFGLVFSHGISGWSSLQNHVFLYNFIFRLLHGTQPTQSVNVIAQAEWFLKKSYSSRQHFSLGTVSISPFSIVCDGRNLTFQQNVSCLQCDWSSHWEIYNRHPKQTILTT